MLLHYFWVVRTDAAFEDAAIESSARRAALIAAHRNRRSAVPMPGRRVRSWRVPLRATGRPGTAIFWKNVIAMTRTIRLSMLIVIVVILAALFGTAFLASGGGAEGTPIVALLALGWAGASVIIGPGLVRNDLRQDLPKLDLLRTYPLRGSSIVAAELLSSTTMLTLVQYALLLIAGIAFLAGETPSARELLIAELVALGAVALPAVNALALSIQNGAALLYPDWVRLGGEPRGGVEAIGQNMLTTLVSLLLLVVGLLVPAAIGGGVGYLLYARLARGAILIGFALALANVLFEVFLLIGWLGRLFERTEPSTATTGA
jgi:hypothetical protein